MTRLVQLAAFLIASAVFGLLIALADGLPEARRIAPSRASPTMAALAPTPAPAPDVPGLLGGYVPALPVTASELVAPTAAPASVSPLPIAAPLIAQARVEPLWTAERLGGVPGDDGSPGYRY